MTITKNDLRKIDEVTLDNIDEMIRSIKKERSQEKRKKEYLNNIKLLKKYFKVGRTYYKIINYNEYNPYLVGALTFEEDFCIDRYIVGGSNDGSLNYEYPGSFDLNYISINILKNEITEEEFAIAFFNHVRSITTETDNLIKERRECAETQI